MRDERVEAIRNDARIGRGTCSPIDECYSDAELIGELDAEMISRPTEALEYFTFTHDIQTDRADDMEAFFASEADTGPCEAADTETGNGCTWLIEVPSGHPEPDSPADMTAIVECGGLVTFRADGWDCEHGHSHDTYGSPAQLAAEATEAVMEAGR